MFDYNLYDTCQYDNGLGMSRSPKNTLNWRNSSPKNAFKGALNDYPCGGYPVLKKWV